MELPVVFSFKAPLGVYQATIGRSTSKPPAKVNTLRGAVHKYLDNADSMQNSAQSEDPRFGAVGESHPFGDKDGVAKGEGAKSADSISYHLEALEESYGAETRVT